MKLRSSLMIALKKHAAESGLGQAQIAKLFGVTQWRLSDLMRGKVDVFALDALGGGGRSTRQAKRSKSCLIL